MSVKTPKKQRKFRFKRPQWHIYLMLAPMVLLSILPIMYIVFTAFKPIGELFAYPPKFITTRPTMDNFKKLFEASEDTVFPLSMYLFNSIVSTLAVVIFGLIIAVAAAYALSKKRFKGRKAIFKMNTLSMMFVATAVSIPRYLIIKEVGLIDSFWANIIPMLATPVGVFLLKQFVDQLPDALIEAAKIDGASHPQIFARIMLPLTKSALISQMILTFVNTCGNFNIDFTFAADSAFTTAT